MKILVLGGGASAVEAAIWARQSSETNEVVLCTAEAVLPYRRPLLPMALTQDVMPERFFIHPAEFYQKHKIAVKLNMNAQKVDVKSQKVLFENQTSEYYDRLVIAIGSSARHIIQQGIVDNVFTLHNYSDAEAIRSALPDCADIAVIGGGVLGLECAFSLLQTNRQVAVIESKDGLMHGVLDDECSAYLLEQLQKHSNLTILTGTKLDHVCNVNRKVQCKFSTGTIRHLTADCVLCAAGIIPAHLTGLYEEETSGWQVDSFMQLNGLANIFGAGDCVKVAGCTGGSYSAARLQGRIAGINAAGGRVEFEPPIPESRATFGQTKLYYAGNITSLGSVEKCEVTSAGLQKFYYRQNKLVGVVLIGDTSQSGNVFQVIADKQ